MNMEQRLRIEQLIAQKDGLLAWARNHGDHAEAERIAAELKTLIEELR